MHSCPAGSPPGGFTLFLLQGFLCPARGSLSVPLPCLVCLGHAVMHGLDMAEVLRDRGPGVVQQFQDITGVGWGLGIRTAPG